uniref:Phenol oxidase n=2 Tax=Blattella germanica TaxID=6973 RepID=A0A076JY37_BLAGE|nr:phenol oxidase [Blattella germanica]
MARAPQSKDLLLMFDRPQEPIFMPKGDDGNVAFDVPSDLLENRIQVDMGIVDRLGASQADEHITVRSIALPDLSIPQSIARDQNFSLFIPLHRRAATRLIEIFLGMRNVDDLVSMCAACRERVNPYLFNYALSVALLHRPDTRNLPVPPLFENFPDKFVDGAIFSKARQESEIFTAGSRQPLEIPMDYTASDLDIEHRLAYFREDLGINLHHWHWHLVYPFNGPRNIVDKNRRGELFYYMHQQIIARYNLERFCNKLARVTRLLNWRDPIPEGYFPKLDSLVASRVWPPRHANALLSDVNREVDQLKVDIQDCERWRDRMYEAIHLGSIVLPNGNRQNLTEDGGIDILGNIMEASILSPNMNLYGDLHNMGHLILGLCHDPDARNLETFSTIGDPATAMRDPIFYRWHAFVDDVFQEHKATLPPYEVNRLTYNGITVKSVEVVADGVPRNEFRTFWKKDDVDLSRGIDFTPRGNVFARFTHLQHTNFKYRIQVENGTNSDKIGTVRIFLGPKFDERGVNMLFRDQRLLFIELDKFTVTLKPKTNNIERNANDSSVTIPFERTFRDLQTSRPSGGTSLEQFNFCGCGWPHHMLIPKGTPEGFPCELFVMVSNFDDDKINQSIEGQCADAASFCGIRDKLYPDKRNMGYPFDRMPRNGVNTLQDFLTPNMRVQDVKIRFTGQTFDVQGAEITNSLT